MWGETPRKCRAKLFLLRWSESPLCTSVPVRKREPCRIGLRGETPERTCRTRLPSFVPIRGEASEDMSGEAPVGLRGKAPHDMRSEVPFRFMCAMFFCASVQVKKEKQSCSMLWGESPRHVGQGSLRLCRVRLQRTGSIGT